MAVMTRGTRSRPIPLIRSGTVLVAETTIDAPTPSVALARIVQAPPQAFDRKGEAEHVGCLAPAEERKEQGEDQDRDLDDHPSEHETGRQLGQDDHPEQERPGQGVGPERLAGDGHHRQHEDQQRNHLDLGREPVDRGAAVPVQSVGVGCSAQTVVALLFLNMTDTPTMAAPIPKVTNTPTIPATRVPIASSSAPSTP